MTSCSAIFKSGPNKGKVCGKINCKTKGHNKVSEYIQKNTDQLSNEEYNKQTEPIKDNDCSDMPSQTINSELDIIEHKVYHNDDNLDKNVEINSTEKKIVDSAIKDWLSTNVKEHQYKISYRINNKQTEEPLFDLKHINKLIRVDFNDKRIFVWFNTIKPCELFVKYIHDELNFECHEVFFNNHCKLFFDIDIQLPQSKYQWLIDNIDDDEPQTMLIGSIIDVYEKALKLSFSNHNVSYFDDKMDIITRCRSKGDTYKISLHLITEYWMSILQAKAVVLDMINCINDIDHKFDIEMIDVITKGIDIQPYHRNGSLSLVGGCKHENGVIYRNEMYSNGIQSSWITQIDSNCEYLNMDAYGVPNSVQRIDISQGFIKEALDNVVNIPDWNDSCFDLSMSSLKANSMIVRRTGSSYCSNCKHNHDNDNTLQIIFSEEKRIAWWKCRHNKDIKARVFYKFEVDFDSYVIDSNFLDELAECNDKKDSEMLICGEINKLMMMLPKELIREVNDLTTYDIVNGDAFDLKAIAKLIKQTVAYIYNDGNYYYIVKSSQTVRFKDGDVKVVQYRNMGGDTGNSFKNMSFTVKISNICYNINLKRVFSICSKSIIYRNVDVVPHNPFIKPEMNGEFNLFGQYQHQYDPNFEIDEKLVSKWTNHILDVVAAGDPIAVEYLIKWFAHLLQHPERKTESVPLIKGRQGCGKNICFNVFQRYVLNPSLSIVCPDMEKLFTRFNSARLGKLLIVLDEAVDSGDRKMNNKMKNFITEERVQIENKGKDIIEVSDFSNYAVITNNDFSSIIEKNDRRYLCMVASEHKVGDREYFNDMAKSLLNVNAGNHIFHWLLRRDLTNFDSRSLPQTAYKKELAAKQTNNVVKWLLYKYENFVDSDINDEFAMTSTEWYKQYTNWCNEIAGESKVYSLNVFSQMMNAEGFEVIKQNIRSADGKRTSIKQRILSQALIHDKLSEYII